MQRNEQLFFHWIPACAGMMVSHFCQLLQFHLRISIMTLKKSLRRALLGSALLTGSMLSNTASAAIIISEVDSAGSGTGASSYNQDWFEITNTGAMAVDLTGWKVDDNSNSFASAVALNGVSSIGAGQSIVFIDTTGSTATAPPSNADIASTQAKFINAWFGANVPAGFSIGYYWGAGIGLGQGGDALNLYTSTGALVTAVTFGAATAGKTFDNAAGLNNTAISQLSAVGVNGAFLSANGAEIGSPGVAAAPVPLPAAAWLLMSGLGLLAPMTRRRG
jgi:Lamin Tail Domain